MVKALREAKVHSSWLSPNLQYEQAVNDFIERILSPDGAFAHDFAEFHEPIHSVCSRILALAETPQGCGARRSGLLPGN